MDRDANVVFISAGMSSPKKRDHLLARRQLYLNYGALTLASLLKSKGYSPILLHGNHGEPQSLLAHLSERDLIPKARPLFLSIPSYYALSWAQDFCRRLKQLAPGTKLIVGGRWVVGSDPKWLKKKIPEIDLIVTGLAESLISRLAVGHDHHDINTDNGVIAAGDGGELPAYPLDHSLVESFHQFQPSIEVSRGCGMGCQFCEERAIPLSSMRQPDILADYMVETIRQYGTKDVRPYLQSSFFLPNPRWAEKLFGEIQRRECQVKWRCETRVDALRSDTIELLAKSGLKVIDLGLETASPTQIARMHKSARPDHYLKAASKVLKDCKAHGVWVKVNILLYAGETNITIKETVSWLQEHANEIKGVSVGPVVIFGPPKQAAPLIAQMEDAGARVVSEESADAVGITAIHPSSEIDAAAAEEISLSLSRTMMDHKAYFDLKSFSYYPRDYTYNHYLSDLRACDQSKLPFDMSKRSPIA